MPIINYSDSTYKFLFEVIWVNQRILGAEQDVLYELLVWQGGHLVEGVRGVMLHEHGVNAARVHPLGLWYTAPATAWKVESMSSYILW